MIDLETIDKVYLYPGSTDLRKGMNALSYLVGELEKEDHLHKLFLFCNRKEKMIKIYEKDETGNWMYLNRLINFFFNEAKKNSREFVFEWGVVSFSPSFMLQ